MAQYPVSLIKVSARSEYTAPSPFFQCNETMSQKFSWHQRPNWINSFFLHTTASIIFNFSFLAFLTQMFHKKLFISWTFPLSCIVKILKFGWYSEIRLIFWNLIVILKFGWNSEIRSKFWNCGIFFLKMVNFAYLEFWKLLVASLVSHWSLVKTESHHTF